MAAPKHTGPTPGIRRLAAVCRTEVPVLTRRLMAAIFTDIPEWTDYSPVSREDLRNGCRSYLTRVLDLLAGDVTVPDRDDVAAAIGRNRAAQGVPLEVMLRTFRLGGQIVWEALLDRADDLAPGEFREIGAATWSVIDGMSSALVTSYRNTELEQVRRDERRRHGLIEDLLGGRAAAAPSDPPAPPPPPPPTVRPFELCEVDGCTWVHWSSTSSWGMCIRSRRNAR
ncbi:hypothetical protein [Nocardia brasiliensis]|uniref:hypothetical protein n=1 Tax=Nocardia brasiliensis TaxID=37326 RepID=UPI002458B658|nr:hypothetical protein [Nocardia brasiliensis]